MPVDFKGQRGWLFGLVLVLGLVAAACGGLAGEPRIVSTVPPGTPEPTEVGYPQTPPDIAAGAQIFAQDCTKCHGDSGTGDGELIGNGQNQIPQAPPDFTDPATAAKAKPQDWFNIITDGQIDNFMPPWKSDLSEQDRWAVTMFVYTLHDNPDALAEGKSLLEKNNIKTDNLPPQNQSVTLTDSDLLTTALTQNASFISTLSDEQKESVSEYLRGLTLTNTDAVGKAVQSPASTEKAGGTPIPTVNGTVTGQVTNGTSGGTVPSNLQATLHSLDSQFNDEPREASVGADGKFSFTDVPFRADRDYIVTIVYQGRTFASDFLAADLTKPSLDLPVKLYEITNDSSVVHIAGWVSQITAIDSVLQIAEVVSFTNTSDKAYSIDQLPNDDRYASVEVKIPAGGQVLSITPDDQRYVVGADGITVIDTSPVLPSEQHIFQFVYSIPYTGDIQIAQPVGYTLQGPFRLLVTPDNINVVSGQLLPLGPQTVGNQSYQGFGASLTLQPSDILNYRVQGAPPSSGNTTPLVTTNANSILPIILIIVGIVAIVVAIVISVRGRKPVPQTAASTNSSTLVDGLIRQIAELDDAHAAGQVDEDTYEKRRGKLKARLAELMDKE